MRAAPVGRRRLALIGHLHWFRWAGEDPFSNASCYACRCGVVRPGL
ncbi:hypothetical protein [Geodermatophilus sp. TF02-6]|nr:hypothetical protein [Geodermatophilus sp. TF02-6]